MSNTSRALISHRILISELHKVKKQNKMQKHNIAGLTQNSQKLCLKLRRQNLRLRAQSVKIREQEKRLHEQAAKIQEQESTIAEIKKHMDEWDQKYIDLTTELVRARDDILSKTSSSPKALTPSPHIQQKFYIPNIKPRAAQVKICTSLHSDLERKRKSDGSSDDIPSKLLVYDPEALEEATKTSKEYYTKEPFKDDREHYKDVTNISNESLLSSKYGKGPSETVTSRSSLSMGSSERGDKMGKGDIGSIISSSLEALFKSPSTIKPRKRKLCEDIDLK